MLSFCVGVLFNGYILIRLGRIRSYFLSSVESLSGDLLSTQLYELAMSLKNYPIVTMTVSLWALIVELLRQFRSGDDQDSPEWFWMYLLLAVLQLLQGTFNLLIYYYRAWRRGTLCAPDETFCGLWALWVGVKQADDQGDQCKERIDSNGSTSSHKNASSRYDYSGSHRMDTALNVDALEMSSHSIGALSGHLMDTADADHALVSVLSPIFDEEENEILADAVGFSGGLESGGIGRARVRSKDHPVYRPPIVMQPNNIPQQVYGVISRSTSFNAFEDSGGHSSSEKTGTTPESTVPLSSFIICL